MGGIAKNRNISINKDNSIAYMRIDKLAESLSKEDFTEVRLNLDKPKKVWVTTLEVKISGFKEKRIIAIVMNADTFSMATDVDYFITNVNQNIVTPEWIVSTYSQRNWVEVFYREVKGWLGLKEYQVRGKRSLIRHFILVFSAYTFILWHKLTGGLRRRWANKLPTRLEFDSRRNVAVHSAPLNTFPEALEAFRTAMSFRFVSWLNQNWHVFAAYKASCGFIWA